MKMEEADKLANKLIQIEQLYGALGVFGAILLIVIGISIWIYHKAFLIKYANSFFERGLAKYKNELTAELGEKFINQTGDIQKNITELKSELNLISGQQTSFLNEKRSSLLNTYTAHVDWVSTIMDKSALDIDENNLHIRKDVVKELTTLKHKFNIASASYQIFGRDEDLNEIMKALLISSTKLQGLKEKQLVEVENLYRERILLKEDLRIAFSRGDNSKDEVKEKLKNNFEKIITINGEIQNELFEEYRSIVDNRTKASSRISKLIKESFENK